MLKKFPEITVAIFVIISIVFFADYLLRFLQGAENKSLVAYILKGGDYLFSLVNKKNTLKDWAPNDLVWLSFLGEPGKQIRQIAYGSLVNLIWGARAAGVEIKILSAYRSYSTQKSLFSFYQKKYDDASGFSAQAGHSEHQLGTAVDFGTGDSSIDLTEKFAQTLQGKWLKENAWKFGFVLSYPKGKEGVTGYTYEPWHYRYIGLEDAVKFIQSGLTLQEFLSQKPQNYENISCNKIETNLKKGDSGSGVGNMQKILKNQGLYNLEDPENYFGENTLLAVISFQETYHKEILAPWGLSKGTGIVGPTTREKLSELCGAI